MECNNLQMSRMEYVVHEIINRDAGHEQHHNRQSPFPCRGLRSVILTPQNRPSACGHKTLLFARPPLRHGGHSAVLKRMTQDDRLVPIGPRRYDIDRSADDVFDALQVISSA